MARIFKNKSGRKTVKPFKKEDINNMILICKKKKQTADDDGDKEQSFLWDRNWFLLHLGRNLAFRIEDLVQLKVDNFTNGGIF